MEIIKFIEENSNWEELLSNPPYCLKIQQSGDYYLLKYNQIESDLSHQLTQECRGLIVKVNNLGLIRSAQIVCHPFHKFFNYGEPNAHEIDWESAGVLEKIDGSFIKLWWDGEWKISTNGSINAFETEINPRPINCPVETYGDLFVLASGYGTWENFVSKRNKMWKDWTYLYELVSPWTRVVVEYKEPKIYFLGSKKNDTGEERNLYDFKKPQWCEYPKDYNVQNLDDLIAMAKELPWSEEGYVVVDKYFNRIKIKSPQYVTAHYCRNNSVITTKRLLDVLKQGEKDEFLVYAEEYKEELEKVEASLYVIDYYINSLTDKLWGYEKVKVEVEDGEWEECVNNVEPLKFETQKDYAIWVNTSVEPWARSYFFQLATVIDGKLEYKEKCEEEPIQWLYKFPESKQVEIVEIVKKVGYPCGD